MSSVRSCRDGRRAAERTAKQAVLATCVYRKLDSAIMVVKTAEDRLRCDGADALNRAMKRGVLVQRLMSPRLIIIGGICAEDSAQVRFTEHDHVVQALPADRANEPLDICILPGSAGCIRPISNTHGAQALHEHWSVRGVSL